MSSKRPCTHVQKLQLVKAAKFFAQMVDFVVREVERLQLFLLEPLRRSVVFGAGDREVDRSGTTGL
jgi:hypothetical protein